MRRKLDAGIEPPVGRRGHAGLENHGEVGLGFARGKRGAAEGVGRAAWFGQEVGAVDEHERPPSHADVARVAEQRQEIRDQTLFVLR